MNMQKLMQEAQKLQRDVEKKQNEIDNMEFLGSSEFCDIVLMGNYKIKKIYFKVESLDKDDIEALGDMIKIAHNDAVDKINKKTEEKLGTINKMGGLF